MYVVYHTVLLHYAAQDPYWTVVIVYMYEPKVLRVFFALESPCALYALILLLHVF